MVEYDRTRLPGVYREARALSEATHDAALSRYCGDLERDGPVDELVDLFLFRRVQ
jgi:hypothetical protein